MSSNESGKGVLPPSRDAFLSDEDLDLRNLSEVELRATWTAWLHQAQSTNDEDRFLYSHGVFIREPATAAVDSSTSRDG